MNAPSPAPVTIASPRPRRRNPRVARMEPPDITLSPIRMRRMASPSAPTIATGRASVNRTTLNVNYGKSRSSPPQLYTETHGIGHYFVVPQYLS
eukprot:maker-scaffold405_size181423-snap-gene-0.38 protein:Tk08182 transcript:maker-scaffold405_size181423-snap-gene-0.38-mRNA-1 annotation:"low quality protein: unconventional myosin-viia"